MKTILFNTDMVCAILNNTKTTTRRAIKPQPEGQPILMPSYSAWPGYFAINGTPKVIKPPYQPGDILYVRETWQYAFDLNGNEQIIEETGRYLYAADDPVPFNDWIMPDGTHRDTMPWHPSIHMPKEAARIFLRATDVRAERLQDIDDEGAKAEGANFRNGKHVGFEEKMRRSAIERFAEIWDGTIKKKDRGRYGWETNPWVWVIDFERIDRNETNLQAQR